MLTIDLDRLGLAPGARLLDLGCGEGRHVRATRLRRGLAAVALDLGEREVTATADSLRQMEPWERRRPAGTAQSAAPPRTAGESPALPIGAAADAGPWLVVRGDTFALPFSDASFDCVVAAEILEHLDDDDAALSEIRRVLKPAGILGISVPRFGPELLCWMLSRDYRHTPGGHVRIYRRGGLRRKLQRHGFAVFAHHFAHALHAPFWWLKCAVGLDRSSALVERYHRLLVRDMFERPWTTQTAERLLNPLIGKSEVFYATLEGGLR